MERMKLDVIHPRTAHTLPGLFRERVRRSPNRIAYHQYDAEQGQWVTSTWAQIAERVALWQKAFLEEGYAPGDRVAVLLNNRRKWVIFDQAALSSGLVVVPLYLNDRPENIAHILRSSGARFLLVQHLEAWNQLAPVMDGLSHVDRVVYLESSAEEPHDPRLRHLSHWLPERADGLQAREGGPGSLATLVYTSGTTGSPKGVMLSHGNILEDAYACLSRVPAGPDDLFLSFLPLSHALERTAGYYLSMMAGSQVAFARSIPLLAEDMHNLRPTVLVSVPRIYERIYQRIHNRLELASFVQRRLFWLAVAAGWRRFRHRQKRGAWHPLALLWPLLDVLVARKVRASLGGRLRVAITGGAPLSEGVARLIIGLGIPLIQGYGLTETSPVIAVNAIDDNAPETVGAPLPGMMVKVNDDGELLVRGSAVMMGYWQDPEGTAQVIDADGWLHTGDQATLDERGHIRITGRLKEIIVLANGRKVPPNDIESAITQDPLFSQAMVIGEAKPYLSMLAVLDRQRWQRVAQELGLDPDNPDLVDTPTVQQHLLERVGRAMHAFPGFAKIREIAVTGEPWTVENGLLTPTLKLRRARIMARFKMRVRALYEGHGL